MIHIGNLIKEKQEQSGMSIGELAALCSTSRNNMKNVFLRETIDTGLLMKICISLDYDFFRHYSALIPFAKSEVEAPKTSQIHAIAKDFEEFVGKAEKIIGTNLAQSNPTDK